MIWILCSVWSHCAKRYSLNCILFRDHSLFIFKVISMVRLFKTSALYFGIVELPDFIHCVAVGWLYPLCSCGIPSFQLLWNLWHWSQLCDQHEQNCRSPVQSHAVTHFCFQMKSTPDTLWSWDYGTFWRWHVLTTSQHWLYQFCWCMRWRR